MTAQHVQVTTQQCYDNATITITEEYAVVEPPAADLPKSCSVFLAGAEDHKQHFVTILKDKYGNSQSTGLTEIWVLLKHGDQWFIMPADDY